jgi:aminoglycoside phosphotransferase (APT) family kinase protein
MICHNDVCLENVVFRSGRAVALLDFDFAAPGRPSFDLAAMARMCVPIDDDVSARRLGFEASDRPARLRLVADTYGLDGSGRFEVLGHLDRAVRVGGTFIRRRVEAGDANFIRVFNEMGGMERYDRRLRWWEESKEEFAAALS